MQQLISFTSDYTRYVLKGGVKFYAWMGSLAVLMVGMMYVFYLQNTDGLIVTGMTSQIHDGLYFANLVFLVGVAAGAVTIVFPAYAYHHEGMHKVTVLGEMLAITGGDHGDDVRVRPHGPARPALAHGAALGHLQLPHSMLGWDVMVLNGYLILNAICGFYYLLVKYTGDTINQKWFMPLVYRRDRLGAVSIHTVTAFLISTMPSRPMWLHSMMPIRFIVDGVCRRSRA